MSPDCPFIKYYPYYPCLHPTSLGVFVSLNSNMYVHGYATLEFRVAFSVPLQSLFMLFLAVLHTARP
ncbi:hypothetical protein CPC08DRAFT_320981 [Agrocybe pediades]|nr:hypothetical protein CPC08DRAFT_320981 [Agrocybe pediades]